MRMEDLSGGCEVSLSQLYHTLIAFKIPVGLRLIYED